MTITNWVAICDIFKIIIGAIMVIPLLILLSIGWCMHYIAKTLINDKILGYMLTSMVKLIEMKKTKL